MTTLSLKHELVTAPGATPSRSVLFLHGILGTGANLRTLAKRFVAVRPAWQGVLVDLRAHGGSLGHEGVDSVDGAAEDVAALASVLAVPVQGVVAHSFGGKVALQLAAKVRLSHVALLDSTPGSRLDFRGSQLTARVLEILDALQGHVWPTREAFIRELMAQGQERGVAQWLAMNGVVEQGQYRLTLELPRIHALMRSYLSLDAWPALERACDTAFHLIIGDRSAVFDASDRLRARALAEQSNGRITVDVLPAGHWVHVDDFEGVLRVLLTRVP